MQINKLNQTFISRPFTPRTTFKTMQVDDALVGRKISSIRLSYTHHIIRCRCVKVHVMVVNKQQLTNPWGNSPGKVNDFEEKNCTRRKISLSNAAHNCSKHEWMERRGQICRPICAYCVTFKVLVKKKNYSHSARTQRTPQN